jgi:putative ABC transport system permease protein
MWQRIWSIARSVTGRSRMEQDLAAELHDHLEREQALLRARGLSAAEARRVALSSFGGVERVREEVRDVRGVTGIADILRDVRFAARRIRRSGRYAVLVVLTIGLGMGAAAVMFSAVDGVLLKPLPYASPEGLVTVWQTKASAGVQQEDPAVANFLDWQQQSRSFSHLVAANPWSVNYRGDEVTEVLEAWTVTEGFFELAGTPPLLGRWFRQEDFDALRAQAGRQGSARPSTVVILDHGLWQRKFGGDPGIVGRSVVLDDVPQTVVGVMPRGFRLPEPTEVWMPNAFSEAQRADRFATYIRVIGRLKPGVTTDAARSDMDALAARLATAWPRSNTGVGVSIVPLEDFLLGAHRKLLYVLLGAVAILVLVTIVNVAALHTTRIARQRKEVAVRTALGARRRDVVRPVVVESILLVLSGGIVGILLAVAGTRALRAVGPSQLPRLDEIAVDARAVLAVLAVVIVSSIVMSVAGIRRGLEREHTGSRTVIGSPSTLRLRRAAVGVQLALGLVLLIGTSLLVRSFQIILAQDKGYTTTNVLSFTTWVYDEYPTRDALFAFVDRARERLGAIAGVRSVAIGSSLPLTDEITGEAADIIVEGAAVAEGQEPQSRATVVSPEYFSTLGIRLVSGRYIDATDGPAGRPVVVVNQAFVRRFFEGRDPIGRTVSVGLMGRAMPREIVGVVGDTRHTRLDGAAEPGAFLPFAQRPLAALTFVLATTVDPSSLVRTVGSAMGELDPRVGMARIATMDALVGAHLRTRQFLLLLLGAFAGLAVTVAAIGVYGVMSQSVAEREREIGVRMALGATARGLVTHFAREAAVMTGVGLVAGLLLAATATRILGGFLYGVAPLDPRSIIEATVLVVLLSLGAALIPTWRATRVEPTRALQDS